jgi:signal transduction histidine kinase
MDQSPDRDAALDYSEYAEYAAASSDDVRDMQFDGTTPATMPVRRWPERATPGVPPADVLARDAIALAQLLAASLRPEQALAQALDIGMRLLPGAHQLAVYVTAGGEADGLLRLAVVTRRADTVASDLAPLPTHTLGFGPVIDQQAMQAARAVQAPGAILIPLRVPGPEAGRYAGHLVGVLVARWEGAQSNRDDDAPGLRLLAPCCTALLERRANADALAEAQRRIAGILSRVAAEDAARDAFLSLTVHELRSPLTAVKGYAQLLMRQARRFNAPAAMGQAAEAVDEQATRMADMISEMHDAVRIRRGDLELHPEPVELGPLVAQAVGQQRKLFPLHEIQVEAAGGPLTGEWDPQRVEQVVGALVNNAARFTPGGGVVAVRVARREQDGQPVAQVCVHDRGVGVAEGDRVRIFEYLYRAPDTQQRHLSGLGLGLFVSRTLVERMGGRLWLEETRTATSGETADPDDSSGSSFCFTLPLRPASPRDEAGAL